MPRVYIDETRRRSGLVVRAVAVAFAIFVAVAASEFAHALPADLDSDTVANASDVCRFLANTGQEDIGGMGSASAPDGVGDICQCGDVSGSGRVEDTDVDALREFLADPTGAALSDEAAARCAVFGDLADCDIVQVAVLRRALADPPLGPLSDAASAQHCPAALSEHIHVATSGALAGNGTPADPMRRITDAVARARADRAGGELPSGGGIEIHVAGGDYLGSYILTELQGNPQLEILPIILNVPRLAVLGETVLIRDAAGLPTGSQVLGRTTLRPVFQLGATQALFLITRTTDGAIGSEVTVDGFVLDGIVDVFLSRAVTVDRVSDFKITNNVVQHAGFGIFSRLASGVIEGNLLSNNVASGAEVFGGSNNDPAHVLVRSNRIEGSGEHGLIFLAVSPSEPANLGTNPFQVEPLQTTFDREVPSDLENIPDTLDATVIGNDIATSRNFGIRLTGVVPPGGATNCSVFYVGYATANSSQELTASLTANIQGNTLSLNGRYGVAMEAGFPCRSDPRRLVYSFDASFAGNSYSGNGNAGALFTFTRWSTSLNPAQLATFKYEEDSALDVTDVDGELIPFDYDNPALDPFDGVTPLDNTLTKNGVLIPPGTSITP